MSLLNYKVIVEYDGTKYEGLQVQNSTKQTIYSKIFDSLSRLLSNDLTELNFCGRTDSGVHALGQVFNFKTSKVFNEKKLVAGINFYLRAESISAISATIVDDNFHARYSCTERSYIYKILNRASKSPIFENRAWIVPYPLNVENMKLACEKFIGTHDFSYFRSIDCSAKTPIKTINSLYIQETGELIEIFISAESFLYRMVRRIVGVLIEIGRGEASVEDVEKMLNCGYKFNIQTAPSYGLYFVNANY